MKYSFSHPDHYLIETIADTSYGKVTPEGDVVGMTGKVNPKTNEVLLIDLSNDKVVARYDWKADKLYSDLDLLSLADLIAVHPSYKEHLIDEMINDMLFYNYTNPN